MEDDGADLVLRGQIDGGNGPDALKLMSVRLELEHIKHSRVLMLSVKAWI